MFANSEAHGGSIIDWGCISTQKASYSYLRQGNMNVYYIALLKSTQYLKFNKIFSFFNMTMLLVILPKKSHSVLVNLALLFYSSLHNP